MGNLRPQAAMPESSQEQRLDAELHLEVRSSCVVVVENGQLVGILTEGDVVRLMAQQRSLDTCLLGQVVSPPAVTLHASAFTDDSVALRLLLQYHIRHLPIVDDQNQLLGLVTYETALLHKPYELAAIM